MNIKDQHMDCQPNQNNSITEKNGKNCSLCRIFKPYSLFHRSSSAKDGLKSSCKECRNAKYRDYSKSDKAKIASRKRQSRWRNTEQAKTYITKYQKSESRRLSLEKYNRSEKNKKNQKKYRTDNPIKVQQSSKKYRQSDVGKRLLREKRARHRLRLRNASLPGCENLIKIFYKNCPDGFEVDHIVPLFGKNVCGLHVPWNLQYLTSLDNKKKGNKF